MAQRKIYFLAYCSYMCTSFIEKRLGPVVKVDTHVCIDYDVTFNAGTFKHSYANIMESKDGYMEGVLWQLTPEQITLLDKLEAYNVCCSKVYGDTEDKNLWFTYKAYHEGCFAEPSLPHISTMLRGAKEHKLLYTTDYLQQKIHSILKKKQFTNIKHSI